MESDETGQPQTPSIAPENLPSSADESDQQAAMRPSELSQRAREEAAARYPGVPWIQIDPNIYLAPQRAPRSENQAMIFEKELIQARILAALGHTIYLPPEQGPRKAKHPDAIVDGLIMEFKTITGNIRKVGENFKDAMGKAENVNVFLKIDAPLSRHAVTRKLSGVIRAKGYLSGLIWVYFKATGELNYWTVEDLR